VSRGLSWRQRLMLVSIAREAERWSRKDRDKPVAWRAVDYGPTSAEDEPDYSTSARIQWNLEQATRRSLRSLERRGLVKLGRYCFWPHAESGGMGQASIFWSYVHPEKYVPGEMRIMTGVVLTAGGRDVVAQEEKARARKRASR
jgi:hypothetical protein